MWKQELSLLEFIGGPFDGFSQMVSVESDELPACVALPLNRKAGRLLGFQVGRSDDSRVAIYQLEQSADCVSYRFRSIRASAKSLQLR
ncbi:MAG: hypothetical protein JWM11_7829 [Planctomycetaceae bacterium]|nr:hypothetical protein [Planctomycetaceae bacterium]